MQIRYGGIVQLLARAVQGVSAQLGYLTCRFVKEQNRPNDAPHNAVAVRGVSAHTAQLGNDTHFYCAKVAGKVGMGHQPVDRRAGWCNGVSSTKLRDQTACMLAATGGLRAAQGVSAATAKTVYDKIRRSPERAWDVKTAARNVRQRPRRRWFNGRIQERYRPKVGAYGRRKSQLAPIVST